MPAKHVTTSTNGAAPVKRQAKKRPLRPDDNYLLKRPLDPQVSPDGKLVAYALQRNERDANERQLSLWVAALDGKSPARRFTWGKRDHSPRWSPDGRFLAFISDRGEKGQVYLAPLDGGDPRQLTKQKHGVNEISWSPDGARIAFVTRTGEHKDSKERSPVEKAAPRVIRDLRYKLDGIGYFDERRTHIFVIDVESGKEKQITDGDWFDGQPSWSPDGKRIAFTSDRERQRHQRQFRADVWTVPAAGGRAHKLTRSRGNASYPVYSPDGRWIAFAGDENGAAGSSKHTHAMLVPARGGAPPRPLSAPLDRTVPGQMPGVLAWTPNSKALLFVALDGGAMSVFRAGIGNGSVSKVVGGQRQIQQFSLTPDGERVAFTASFSSDAPELYAASLESGARERNLSHANDDLLAVARLAATKRMTSRAADGVETESFVLYPPGYRPGRRYPMILDVHGGPHGAHPQVGFNARPQALAAAGYVVVMPNPRGSAGYGETFQHACVRDRGGGDYNDLMAAVDALVRKGVADPDRLFVVGYSYGGFMSTWVIGHTTRFKATMIGAPVSNQISMRGTTDIPLFDDYAMGGTPYTNRDEWTARSPVTYLHNVTAAVMIEHHEGDLRCPIGQAEEIFQNLKLLGKEVEFVRYPGGFHRFDTHSPSQDVDSMQRMIAWFDAHGGRPSAQGRSRSRLRKSRAKGGRVRVSANGARAARNGARSVRRRVAERV